MSASADPPAKLPSLLRGTAVSGAGMAASLATGLVLDAVIALSLGAGRESDAFFVAARLPLGVNLLILAGATQALTPALVRSLESEDDHGLGARMLWATLLVGGALWALAALVAGPAVRLTAPGLDAHGLDAAVRASRVLFGVVPLVLAAEVLRAYVNARERFAAAGLMNVLMNGAAAGWIIAGHANSASDLAVGYVIGAAVQLVFIAIVAGRRGFGFRPRDWGDGQAAAVARLSVKPNAAGGVNLGNRVAEQLLLSFLPSGSITIVNYGNRLISAIGGLINRSATVAALPRLTRAAGSGDAVALRKTTTDLVRITAIAALPLTALTVVLGPAAVQVVFRRGDFTHADAVLLGSVLAMYGLSLVGSGVQRALLAPWLAHLQTHMQLRSAVLGVVIDLALLLPCVALFGGDTRRGVIGVALAFSLAQYAIAAYCWRKLWRELGIKLDVARSLRAPALASGTAAFVMLAVSMGIHAAAGNRIEVLGKGTLVALVGALVFTPVLLYGGRRLGATRAPY